MSVGSLGPTVRCWVRAFLAGWLSLVLAVSPQAVLAAKTKLAGVEVFDAVWQAVAESYTGPALAEVDWFAVRAELRPKAEQAKDDASLHQVIRQMLARLNDPYTYYVSPQEMAEAAKQQQAGDRLDIVGVGMLLGQMPDGCTMVREVLPKGPAARAGVRQGSRIAAVNGKVVKGVPVADVATQIRGEKGSKVTLTILAPDGKQRNVTLTRAPVSFVAQVTSKVLPGNIGYLYIPGGGDGFETKVLAKLRKLHRTDGLIVDLRSGWSGIDLGHMTPLLRIAGLFTDKSLGTLISRQGALLLTPQSKWEDTSAQSWLASILTPPPTAMDVYKKPLVFLVDESTTWEILAMGMQEAGRAQVVGRPTARGRGALAAGYELGDGSGLSLTVTYYSSPRGNTLGQGMQPDITVPLDTEHLAAWYRGEDLDIAAAQQALAGQIALTKKRR